MHMLYNVVSIFLLHFSNPVDAMLQYLQITTKRFSKSNQLKDVCRWVLNAYFCRTFFLPFFVLFSLVLFFFYFILSFFRLLLIHPFSIFNFFSLSFLHCFIFSFFHLPQHSFTFSLKTSSRRISTVNLCHVFFARRSRSSSWTLLGVKHTSPISNSGYWNSSKVKVSLLVMIQALPTRNSYKSTRRWIGNSKQTCPNVFLSSFRKKKQSFDIIS